MTITTKEQAFEILDNDRSKMPREAIQFLFECSTDEAIIDKINTSFERVSTLNDTNPIDSPAYDRSALWYAIVAENHLSERLVPAIISLLEQTPKDHVLKEQLAFLVAKLCDTLGDKAIVPFLETIARDARTGMVKDTIVYLVNSIYYVTDEHLPILKEILDARDTPCLDLLSETIAFAKIKKVLPELKRTYAYHLREEQLGDYQYMTPSIRASITKIEDNTTKKIIAPLEVELRENWQDYYYDYEFYWGYPRHISSKAEAFEEIEKATFMLPDEAIKFLYNHPPDEEIKNKILHYVGNAYNEDLMYNEEKDEYTLAPLIYVLLADKYLDEDFIPIIIYLFNNKHETWEYIDEEAISLLSLLCKQLGDAAITPFIQAMIEAVKESDKKEGIEAYNHTVNYMAECVYFATEKHVPLLKELLSYHKCANLHMVANKARKANLHALIPDIEKLYQYHLEEEHKYDLGFLYASKELKYTLDEFKTGKIEFPNQDKPAYENKYSWEQIVRGYNRDSIVLPPPTYTPIPKPKKNYKKALKKRGTLVSEHTPKVGRNAPCPCGSGKKYKRCHGKK